MNLEPGSFQDLKKTDHSHHPRRQFSTGSEVASIGPIYLETKDMATKKKMDRDTRDRFRSGPKMTEKELIEQVLQKNQEVIFAIKGSKFAPEHLRGELIGEVQFYEVLNEPDNDKLKDRLFKNGLLTNADTGNLILESSTMVDFDSRFGPGIGSSARRVACLKILEMYQQFFDTDKEPVILAFIEDANTSAIRSIVATGFTQIGKIQYDSGSPEKDNVYKLDWNKLRSLLRKNPNEARSFEAPGI